MGFDSFQLVLDPHQPVYFSGQVLKGYVLCSASEPLSCKKITVKVKGKAKVQWTESHGKNSSTYSAKEKYLEVRHQVWCGSENDNKLPVGEHRLPFSVVLPLGLPSSFESTAGRVRYSLKAEADQPWSLDVLDKKYFSVNCIYDLNINPLSRRQIYGEKNKTLCCLCCVQGPIHLMMRADRTGYVPGESIVLSGEVVNNSRSTIKYSEVKIMQQIKYITPNKSKSEIRTVQRVYRPQIQAGERDEWAAILVPIPAVPSSFLQHCNIIEIHYCVRLMAKLGMCKVAKLDLPIIIGSIPLRNAPSTQLPEGERAVMGGTILTTSLSQTHQFNSNPPNLNLPVPRHPSAPPTYDSAPPPYSDTFLPDDYKNVSPPSYASCVFSQDVHTRAMGRQGPARQTHSSHNSDNDDGGFAPQYITFDNL
ncbi:hypothetical protein Pmani_005468 [Petrolisthes manimaculis]|uniref:Arrestin C-terminal-like domain-containing protein n=1 Tax=Petrolisthes manimaculis TaxID=1843537 RepID=A0AAE1QCB3_9EUCA|nr:hypothetical protein Pmani_005468 [Petrolisthes manimaculis]